MIPKRLRLVAMRMLTTIFTKKTPNSGGFFLFLSVKIMVLSTKLPKNNCITIIFIIYKFLNRSGLSPFKENRLHLLLPMKVTEENNNSKQHCIKNPDGTFRNYLCPNPGHPDVQQAAFGFQREAVSKWYIDCVSTKIYKTWYICTLLKTIS